jgi:phage baseplate assembly protein W
MAFIVRNKFPIDSQPQKAVGVNIPFSNGSVFTSNYLTRDAIKNNLLNFFSTKKGERVMNPLFGSIIQSTVFESLTSDINDTLQTIIKDEINAYFNFVNIQSIDVLPNEDFNTLNITLTYQVSNFGINDTINITI